MTSILWLVTQLPLLYCVWPSHYHSLTLFCSMLSLHSFSLVILSPNTLLIFQRFIVKVCTEYNQFWSFVQNGRALWLEVVDFCWPVLVGILLAVLPAWQTRYRWWYQRRPWGHRTIYHTHQGDSYCTYVAVNNTSTLLAGVQPSVPSDTHHQVDPLPPTFLTNLDLCNHWQNQSVTSLTFVLNVTSSSDHNMISPNTT